MLEQDIKNLKEKYNILSNLNNLLKVRLKAYEELSRIISMEEDIETALNNTLDLILDLFNLPTGSLMILDRTKKYMAISVARGDKAEQIKAIKIEMGKGIAGKVAQDGKSLVINNVEHSEDFNRRIGQQVGYVPRNILCVPIISKNIVHGVIEIMDKADSDFNDDDKNLLESIAGSVAIGILNADLYQLAHSTVNRLTTLIEVSKIINTTMDLQQLLDRIMVFAKDVLSTEGSSLMLLDEKTHELYFNVTTGTAKEKLKEVRIPFGKGIAGIVAETGKGVIVNDAVNDPRVFKEADKTTQMVTKNILAVPMRVKDRVVGVLEAINSLEKDYFDNYDLELFQAFADHAGIAIFNRELIQNLRIANQEINRSYKEIKAMYEMSNRVTNETNFDHLFKIAVEVINNIFGLERVSLMLYDEKEDALVIKEAVGIEKKNIPGIRVRRGEKISGFVFQKNEPVLIKDMENEPVFGRNKKLRYRSKSFISVPLKLREKVIGVLNVTDRMDRLGFDEKDLITFIAISNQIGKSYENIIYYNEFLEKQRIEKELEITRDIQQSVLPKKFPEFMNMDISAVNIPAKEVGGDFYDYIGIDDIMHTFLIADVSGKSLPASMFMAFSRSITRVEAYNLVSPSKVLEESNKYIFKDSQSGMFVTMFYLVLNLKKNSILFGSAGHNEQLLYKRSKDDFLYLKVRGIPLGVSPESRYNEEEIPYEQGDILVLYTDGVTEAINKIGAEFGLDRLKEIVLKNKSQSSEIIRDKIMKAIDDFTHGLPQFDDITLLIIRFK
ncbi:MAG: GAF domain-containing protein [bacterium]|nr:GAF domain-containing protein [bacterium]